jgi:hypothetical protein
VLDLEHVDLVQFLDLLYDTQGDQSRQALAVGRALTTLSFGGWSGRISHNVTPSLTSRPPRKVYLIGQTTSAVVKTRSSRLIQPPPSWTTSTIARLME